MKKYSAPLILNIILLLSFGNNVLAIGGWQKKIAPLMTTWSENMDTLNVLGEYPRPQFVRSEWLNLNGVWDYKVSEGMGIYRANQKFTNRILVPFPIESALSGIMDTDYENYKKAHLYRRYLTIPVSMKGKNILLQFGAVDWEAEVYVNGTFVGEHKGGYDPFYFDITNYLNASGPQEIQVQVNDPGSFGGQPHGKQQDHPGGIWYTESSGIWQTVWIEPVNKTYIYDYSITPDLDKRLVRVKVKILNSVATTQVVIKVYDKGNLISTHTTANNTEIAIPVANPKLWSPESPFLYDLKFEIVNSDVVVDEVGSYFGMRKISLGKIETVPCILLNNKPVFQFGFLDQGFWPDGLYTPPSDEALRYDLVKSKELGMNMTRKHIKVESARWFYHCDTMGLLVWQDMPCAESGGSLGAISWQKLNFYREMKNVINAFKNSPSIISWVPYNEAWGQDSYTDSHTIKGVEQALLADTTRLINPASGFTNFELGDIVDRHHYPSPGIWQNTVQNRAAVCGEYGGITLKVDNHLWKGSGIEYTSVKDGEELTTRFIQYANEVKGLQGNGLWGAVYTEISDVEEELNGLMTYDRKVVKVNQAQTQRIKAVVESCKNKMLIPVLPTALNYPNVEWKYTLTNFTDWNQTAYNDNSWKKGFAGFGAGSPPETAIRTEWSNNTIYLRKTFHVGDLTNEEIESLRFLIYYDEDCTIYLNGVLAATTKGFVSDYKAISMSEAAKAAMHKNADNVIAVKCIQTGGGQYIDLGIMKEVSISSLVPDGYLPSSIVNNPSKTALDIYPNPTMSGEFCILADHTVEAIEIFDMTGKIVKTFHAQNTCNLNNCAKGIYLVKVQTNQNVFTSKVIFK